MNDLEASFHRLDNLKFQMHKLISNLGKGVDYRFTETLQAIFNDFDSTFLNIQSLLPYFIQIPEEKQNQVLKQVKSDYEVKKEKNRNRYLKEIDQNKQRFQYIIDKINTASTSFSDQIAKYQKDFEEKLKQLDCFFVDVRIAKTLHYNEKINKIDTKLAEIRQDQQNERESEEKRISNTYVGHIEQKNNKISESKKAINEINQEKETKLKNSDDKIEELKRKHESALELINNRHDIEIQEIITKQNEVQSLISTEEERIDTLNRRATLAENNYKTRLLFTRNSMLMDHQLKMKECQTSINDIDKKISNVKKVMSKLDKNAEENIRQNIQIWRKRVDDELERRNKVVPQIEEELKNQYEEQVNRKKEELKRLNIEISDNQLRSVTIHAAAEDKRHDKFSALEAKFKDEIDKLKDELERIQHYLSKVQEEWDSIRDSTNCIFHHRLIELRSMIDMQRVQHESKVTQVISKNEPQPDTTDYMAMLDEELGRLEEDLKSEENRLLNDKMIQLKMKLEEEKTRGLLSTRKQNLEEINMLKETESHIKEQCQQANEEARKLLDSYREKQEAFALKLDQNLNDKIAEILRKNDEEKEAMQKEINEIQKETEKVKQETSDTQLLIQETKEGRKKAPENEEEENEIRKEFEQKKSELQNEINSLREEVKLLKNTRVDLSSKEKEEQAKLAKNKNILEAEREQYIKESDRGRNEIEFKYKRLTEEQRKILQNMQNMWDQEVEEKKQYKAQLLADKEKLIETQTKKQQDTDNQFRAKTTEVRAKKAQNFKTIEDDNQKKIEEAEDQLQEKIQKRRDEYSRQEKYKIQDNQLLLRKKNDEYQKEYILLENENSQISSKNKELQNKLMKRLQWVCPSCEKLEKEIKDIKKSILDIVQRIHEMEKEDGNRQFTLAHFGQSSRLLPRLRTKNEHADVV